MIINRNEPQVSEGKEFELLETDVYVMEIKSATIEPDQYSPRDDGTYEDKLVLVWEDTESGLSVWQRMKPWYGVTRAGAPSKFKEFIDSLAEQGMIGDEFDPEKDLPGIKQRVHVEKYTKTMGPNAGKFGNKVVSVLPLESKRKGKAQSGPAHNEAQIRREIRDLYRQANQIKPNPLSEDLLMAEVDDMTVPQLIQHRAAMQAALIEADGGLIPF